MAVIEAIPQPPVSFPIRQRRRARWFPIPGLPLVVLVLLVVAAVFAPLLAPHPERYGNLRDRHSRPALLGERNSFMLGTDSLGRDIYSRILFGARVSLIVSASTLLIAGSVGIVLGLISGYASGWADEVIMRFVDAANAIPVILIALVLAVVVGPSFGLLLGVLSLGQWPRFARQVRAETLSLKERDYVMLARVAGASVPRILFRHILPGVFNTLLVIATMQVGTVILAEASLSFLGVGVPPPTPSWGGMVSDGRLYLTTAWWVSTFPGLAIALTVLSLVFLGDWLRDRLDPHLRQL